jgi:hypothetical protein
LAFLFLIVMFPIDFFIFEFYYNVFKMIFDTFTKIFFLTVSYNLFLDNVQPDQGLLGSDCQVVGMELLLLSSLARVRVWMGPFLGSFHFYIHFHVGQI